MHDAARSYVSRFATNQPITVVEIGSLNVNGQVRDFFPNATYTGIDIVDGAGVDRVADGATYTPRRKADLVVCCEVFEHTPDWREIVWNVHAAILKPGGRFVVTAAGPGREPHSADGGRLKGGEYYGNITAGALLNTLEWGGFTGIEVDVYDTDVRATGVR